MLAFTGVPASCPLSLSIVVVLFQFFASPCSYFSSEHISNRYALSYNIHPLFDHCFSRHFNFWFFVSTSSMPVIAAHRFVCNFFLATNICFTLIKFGMQNEYFIGNGFSQHEHLDGGPVAAQEKRKMSHGVKLHNSISNDQILCKRDLKCPVHFSYVSNFVAGYGFFSSI